MAKIWRHPKLGEFAASKSGNGCSRKMTVPAFAAFSYDTGYSNAPRSTGDFTLSFSGWLANDRLEVPTPGMVAVAEKLLADPNKTVQMVVAALWEDFNGRGPDSGMWWHGNMKDIRATFQEMELPTPTRPDDLLKVLRLDSIAVFNKSFELSDPVAYLQFNAAFEQEHDLTVLSNGDAILGDGYAGDATPWKSKETKAGKKPKNPFG